MEKADPAERIQLMFDQILLMVNDPRRSYNLIQFCNCMFLLHNCIINTEQA